MRFEKWNSSHKRNKTLPRPKGATESVFFTKSAKNKTNIIRFFSVHCHFVGYSAPKVILCNIRNEWKTEIRS